MFGRLVKEHRLEHGISLNMMADICGVSRHTIVKWETGKVVPTKLSIAKVARALKWNEELRFEVLMWSEDNSNKKKRIKMELTDEFYNLLHKLEDEFGSASRIPDDDERLFNLKVMIGVETKRSQGFNKLKVDRLRKKHGITRRDLSVCLGHSPGWFTGSFLRSEVFTELQAKVFAEFFDVDHNVFRES